MLATLKDGFEVIVRDDCADDWEFLETLNAIDEGDSGKIVTVAKRLMDPEELSKLKEHCREDGKVTISRMADAIRELLESLGDSKN